MFIIAGISLKIWNWNLLLHLILAGADSKISLMKGLLQLEELAVFAAAVFLLFQLPLHLSWWVYILLFLSPDIGMIGYLMNSRTGAITYNFTHHKALAICLVAVGFFTGHETFQLYGFLLLAHSSFDRVLGFGLKYPDAFKHTSLGNL